MRKLSAEAPAAALVNASEINGVGYMPRSPSIAPQNRNRDVYLVLDDFGRLGRAWREARRWSETYSKGNTKIQSASLPSIPPEAGRAT